MPTRCRRHEGTAGWPQPGVIRLRRETAATKDSLQLAQLVRLQPQALLVVPADPLGPALLPQDNLALARLGVDQDHKQLVAGARAGKSRQQAFVFLHLSSASFLQDQLVSPGDAQVVADPGVFDPDLPVAMKKLLRIAL